MFNCHMELAITIFTDAKFCLQARFMSNVFICYLIFCYTIKFGYLFNFC